jgi:lipopolysaccharide transport system ATP-binding protein
MLAREARNFVRKAVDVLQGRQVVQGDEVEEFWTLKNVSADVPTISILALRDMLR